MSKGLEYSDLIVEGFLKVGAKISIFLNIVDSQKLKEKSNRREE